MSRPAHPSLRRHLVSQTDWASRGSADAAQCAGALALATRHHCALRYCRLEILGADGVGLVHPETGACTLQPELDSGGCCRVAAAASPAACCHWRAARGGHGNCKSSRPCDFGEPLGSVFEMQTSSMSFERHVAGSGCPGHMSAPNILALTPAPAPPRMGHRRASCARHCRRRCGSGRRGCRRSDLRSGPSARHCRA